MLSVARHSIYEIFPPKRVENNGHQPPLATPTGWDGVGACLACSTTNFDPRINNTPRDDPSLRHELDFLSIYVARASYATSSFITSPARNGIAFATIAIFSLSESDFSPRFKPLQTLLSEGSSSSNGRGRGREREEKDGREETRRDLRKMKGKKVTFFSRYDYVRPFDK